MPNVAVVGTQWGDEGKGKIVDLLTEYADLIVRFQGGNNAGHTLLVQNEKYILHLVPSGILYPEKLCLIGNGVVVDPQVLKNEISGLRERGIEVTPSRLRVSARAHMIMPYHKALDIAREEARGRVKIGTTGRGIGPCYEDKVGRRGIRLIDFIDRQGFMKRYLANLSEKEKYLRYVLGSDLPLEAEGERETLIELSRELAPYVSNVSVEIQKAVDSGRSVLFEGAQGTQLDIDHGTYPYVTSSNPVAGSACSGAGVGPRILDCVLGVVKAYTTRVGAGVFPTELQDETGTYLQEKGAEFGSTTGRKRRCGWQDMVVLREAARLNSLSGLAITKLDVLSGLDTIRICTGYENDEGLQEAMPPSLEELEKCRPIYEDLPGWSQPIGEARSFSELPMNAQDYLHRIEALSGVPIYLISVGPSREQTITERNPFDSDSTT